MSLPLYLPALGIANALGNTKVAVLEGLLAGKQSGIVRRSDLLAGGDVYVAQTQESLRLPDEDPEFNSRNNRLLWAACEQICDQIRDVVQSFGREHIAVVVGTSTSGIGETERALKVYRATGAFPGSYRQTQQEPGSPALFLATKLGLTNAAITVSTACSSSAKAFVTARQLMESGFCRAAIVGGADTLCQLTTNGFKALEVLSTTVCRPFSRDRDGITLGEGAAVFIVVPEPCPIELAGMGESSDAYHISSPDPTGRGVETAMKHALESAEITSQQIDYINLHGTGTMQNDRAEAAAVNRLFSEKVPCSSTKWLTGHTLGAAGATELGLCWLILSTLNKHRLLPPHVFGGRRDERLAFLNLTRRGDCYGPGVRHILSNSFAFGGNNCSLILKRNGEKEATGV